MRRYFIGVLIVFCLIILLIILLVHGGGKPTVPNSTASLQSYANTDATVQETIIGPVNAQSEHNELQITIGSSSATLEVLQGYDNNVVKSQSYPNTESAYSVFLHALNYAGFTKGNTASDLSDSSGYCPLGDQYVFALQQDGKTLERYWATNCSGTPRTFDGNLALNLTLFRQQIPDYGILSGNLNL